MFSKNTLYFVLLSQEYFNNFELYDEFQDGLLRGHGVMLIDVNNLLIAIPLRSSLSPNMKKSKHLFPYEIYTKAEGNKSYLKALDFSKLTIISEKYVRHDTNYLFKDKKEKQFYLDNFNRIQLRLTNYIKKYKKICFKIETNERLKAPTLKPYRYSTLRNFHNFLEINVSKEDVKEQLNQAFEKI